MSGDGDPRQLVAIGGLGTPAECRALWRYLLDQVPGREAGPRVGFLATATGDAQASLSRFYAGFGRLACRPSHLPLFGRTPDPRAWIAEQDVVLVGGGNTRSMLAVWRVWEVDEALREAWARGTLLAGWSAGAICWFEAGVTDSWAGRLAPLPGLGLLPGSCCPHYDGEAERRPAYRRLLDEGALPAGVALDDTAALHFRGTRAWRALACRPGAAVHGVAPHGGETSPALETHLLGVQA